MFYVLSKDGTPLMPTTRYRHIKNLIKEGKAIKINSNPFTVQLLYDTPNGVQNLILGVDPGRTNIGLSVVREDGTPVFMAEVKTRNREIPKLMSARKQYRHRHRAQRRRQKRIRRAISAGTTTTKPCEEYKAVNSTKKIGVIKHKLPGCEEFIRCNGIRNKEARFNNRKRPSGWLTPTANQLRQTHISAVRKVQKILPITGIVLEINRFAFMALDNPDVRKWQYQRGPLYKKGSVNDAVSEAQDGKCLLCEAPIAHYHHIVPRSKGGSDTLPNIVGLCVHCHEKVHTDKRTAERLGRIKSGQNKKYGALSVLGQIIPSLVQAYAEILPTTVTDGRSTTRFREAHGLAKTHSTDAYCIACSILDDPVVSDNGKKVYQMRQFRRHDRQSCSQERITRKYMIDDTVVAENRHKATGQFSDSLEEYTANGGRTDCLTAKSHPAVKKHMDRILPGAVMSVGGKPKVMVASQGRQKNGQPQYYHFSDGTKATPRHCKLIRHNEGLVFV